MNEKFDLLIKGARIVDGTGQPSYRGDVGISQGQIAQISPDLDPLLSRQVIMADDLVLCPGFIDAHSHDDLYLIHKPRADEKIRQGVTTTVIGNCGFSAAPVALGHMAAHKALLSSIGSNYFTDESLDFPSFDDFLKQLRCKALGIHVAALVGHSTIRNAVMGMIQRSPMQSELRQMCELTAQAMTAGAYGLSSGLIYPPGGSAKTDELIELSRVVASYGGIYASHIRNEADHILSAVEEAIDIGRQSGVRVHMAHHQIGGKANWGKSAQSLLAMADARKEGIEVSCDQYPYEAGCTFLAALLPPYALDGSPEDCARKLIDAAYRKSITDDMLRPGTQWENLIDEAGFDGILISFSASRPDYAGRSLANIASAEGRQPQEVVFDLIVAEGYRTTILLYTTDEADTLRIMKDPMSMFASDGIPSFDNSRVHPRFCGSFPRILGHFSRDKGVLSLEEAVRKMTSLTARTFQLAQKGQVVQGYDADLVLFDPDTVADCATYDSPLLAPRGIRFVFLNGQPAILEGTPTGTAPGKVLRFNRRTRSPNAPLDKNSVK